MNSNALLSASISPPFLAFIFPHPLSALYCLAHCLFHPSYPQGPRRARQRSVHSSIILCALFYSYCRHFPQLSAYLSTVIKDGTPLGISNRYHLFACTRDVHALGYSPRRSSQVSPRSPPFSPLSLPPMLPPALPLRSLEGVIHLAPKLQLRSPSFKGLFPWPSTADF